MSHGKIFAGLMLFLLLAISPFLAAMGSKVDKPAQNSEGHYNLDLEADEEDRRDAIEDGHFKHKVEPWRAYHMKFVSIADPKGIEENCSDCHGEAKTFCNQCHTYTGVPLISQAWLGELDEDEEDDEEEEKDKEEDDEEEEKEDKES